MRYQGKNLKKAHITRKTKTIVTYQINCPYCHCEHVGHWDKSSFVVQCQNCHKFFEIDWSESEGEWE
jgi:transcription elongation factor Elf1